MPVPPGQREEGGPAKESGTGGMGDRGKGQRLPVRPNPQVPSRGTKSLKELIVSVLGSCHFSSTQNHSSAFLAAPSSRPLKSLQGNHPGGRMLRPATALPATEATFAAALVLLPRQLLGTSLVVWPNTDLLAHGSGGQKAKVGPAGLVSRRGPLCVPSGGAGGFSGGVPHLLCHALEPAFRGRGRSPPPSEAAPSDLCFCPCISILWLTSCLPLTGTPVVTRPPW